MFLGSIAVQSMSHPIRGNTFPLRFPRAVKDVRIVLTVGGICVYEYNAKGVDDVEHHCEEGRESLEVAVVAGNSVWLSGKPRISTRQNVE